MLSSLNNERNELAQNIAQKLAVKIPPKARVTQGNYSHPKKEKASERKGVTCHDAFTAVF